MEVNPYMLRLSKHSTHKLIIDLVGRDRTVLDVGCNSGYIGASAHRSNTFYGIDYLPGTAAKAKKIYKDAAVYDINTLEPLPWKKRFDAIILADVLEHLNDPERALAYLTKKYLAPGGEVIISLPNVANWSIRLKLLLGKFNYTETGILDQTHLHLYTFQSAKQLVKTSGLHTKRELGGTSFFGPLIRILPMFRGALAHEIVLCAGHVHDEMNPATSLT